MSYAEIVGYRGSDPNQLHGIPTLLDAAKILSASSLSELYELAGVAVPPNFTFGYIEVRLPDDRERYAFVDSRWVRLE